MASFITDLIPIVLTLITALLILVSTVFFLSGLDDFFIDIYYATRSLYRKLFVMRKYSPLSEEQLLQPGEKLAAIMIPSWDESAVIRRMLENTLQTLNYSNYHIFVGTYPNDQSTQREVEIAREHYDNVHRIVCPKDGPTNKADCLNWVYQGILHFEKENNVRFDFFTIHDSEDIVHPLSLKLFNYLIPHKDMVQIPVLPLETKWYHFTAGHYIDEFSENHFKDLVVRESLSRSIPIPCAGVGCAFSRHALDLVGDKTRNQLYSINSLTEDYDFGFRLNQLGLKQIFANPAIKRVTTKRSFWTGKSKQVKVNEYIVTREYFPTKFWSAVRQKSRWMVGITLQGWSELGWRGSAWTKYMLFRDRKSLLTNQINIIGYVVLMIMLALSLYSWLFPDSYQYPPFVERGSWLWYLILGATFFLLLRLFTQAFFVGRFYGWRQGLLSIPRRIWGNIINYAAATRAVYLYINYLYTGRLIPWDKTDHAFPSESELVSYRRKLGDLLLEKRFITVSQLEEALARQQEVNRPLGSILIEMGLVQEEDLIQILGMQMQLSTREVDPNDTPLELLRILPHNLAVEYSVFPVEMREDGVLVIVSNNLLSPEQMKQLSAQLSLPVELCLATRHDAAFAIRYGYERLEKADGGIQKSYLGRLLLERNIITPDQLRKALKVQRRSYTRLGDILVEEGMIALESFNEAISDYSCISGPLGDCLVRNGSISQEQLERALQMQKTRFRPLGEVMVELGMISINTLQEILKEQSNET